MSLTNGASCVVYFIGAALAAPFAIAYIALAKYLMPESYFHSYHGLIVLAAVVLGVLSFMACVYAFMFGWMAISVFKQFGFKGGIKFMCWMFGGGGENEEIRKMCVKELEENNGPS